MDPAWPLGPEIDVMRLPRSLCSWAASLGYLDNIPSNIQACCCWICTLSHSSFIPLIASLIYFLGGILWPSAVFYSYSHLLLVLLSRHPVTHKSSWLSWKSNQANILSAFAKWSVIHEILPGLRAECSSCWEAHSTLPLSLPAWPLEEEIWLNWFKLWCFFSLCESFKEIVH